jgi:CheY-like chemotaxis protein
LRWLVSHLSLSNQMLGMSNSSSCILHVEDEEADQFLVQFAFKRAGVDIPLRTVTDGELAIQYLSGAGAFADRQNYPLPRLVLLDLKLPKRGGLEVLEWIRQQPGFRSLVVVIFSSSAQPGDLERAYHLGANSFVQKPPGLEPTVEFARLLKGWWLGQNRFAPLRASESAERAA